MAEYTEQPAVRRPAAAARRAQAADVARHAGALRRAARTTCWTGRRPPLMALGAGPGVDAASCCASAMQDATVIVAPVHELDDFGAEELAGKTIITSTVNDERIAQFSDKGVHMVIDGAPLLFGHVLGPSLLDAMIIAATGKAPTTSSRTTTWRSSPGCSSSRASSTRTASGASNRFAFVIHPLSQEYFKNIKPIELLSHVSPPVFMDTLEKVMAYAPPFVYSKITGIRSPTGVEAEGWLISVGGTPKEIMSHSPEFTYRRLLDAARMAKRLGAQIMGLGAFTKVVGDAGLTVARRAPLPITTGNSYSASGALWAAHDAVLRLGLRAAAAARPEGASSRRWWSARPERSARCARGCWRWSPRRCTWCRPRPRSCSRSRARSCKETPDAQAVPLVARRQGHRRDGHDRHRDLGRRQEGARHHEGQARLRDHRRRAPARPAAGGGGEAPGRAGDRVRRDPAARRTCR